MTKPIVTVAKVGVMKCERKCIVKLSVKVRLEKQMVVKLRQKWKITGADHALGVRGGDD